MGGTFEETFEKDSKEGCTLVVIPELQVKHKEFVEKHKRSSAGEWHDQE